METPRAEESAVVKLKRERDDHLAERYRGPDLTPEQRAKWVPLRIKVIEATIAELEFMDSLLEEPLTDERRAKIIDDLYEETLENLGREPADMMDFSTSSDWELVRDHESYLEGLVDETVG